MHCKNVYLPLKLINNLLLTMLIIESRKGENVDRMLRRLKKKSDRTKLMKKFRARQHFTKPSDERRMEILKAAHRERYIREHL